MADQKIELLLTALREVLENGQDVNVAEVPFINFKGDIPGKGLIWSGDGYNKQLIYAANPGRFFVSETIDLAKGKGISVNNVKVIDDTELGSTVTKSNLREVGRLKGLIVDGGLSVNQYLVYNATTDRLGIGTDQPNATLSILDQNLELVFGASEPNVGSMGTFNSADLELVTDNTARLTIGAGGDITLGNTNFGPTKVKIVGSLGVNVSSIDPRTDLHVSGAIKFNDKLHLSGSEAPTSGAFNEGDILWNNNPQPGCFIGWVCIRAGNPGLWSGFGRIE